MLNKILSIILFILILPLTLIIFSLIFLIDGRPVFFTQKRAGINRTFFTLIKFRSMNINVNDVASHKIDNVDTLLNHIRQQSKENLVRRASALPEMRGRSSGFVDQLGKRMDQ